LEVLVLFAISRQELLRARGTGPFAAGDTRFCALSWNGVLRTASYLKFYGRNSTGDPWSVSFCLQSFVAQAFDRIHAGSSGGRDGPE
jgi:hypothetical protein